MTDNNPNKENINIPQARMLMILAVISLTAAIIIGVIGYQYSFNKTKAHFQDFYLAKAKLFADIGRNSEQLSDKDLLQLLADLWNTNPNRPDDEYLCIVNENTELILHTLHPTTIGSNVAKNKLLGNKDVPACTLGDFSGGMDNYVGKYISGSGEHQLAAFIRFPERKWFIGVSRSESILQKEIRSGMKPVLIVFLIICCILFPLTFIQASVVFKGILKNRFKIEEKLKQNEKNFRRSILHAPVPIIIHSESGKVHHLNNEWIKKSGYSIEEIPSIQAWVKKAYGNKAERIKQEIDQLYSIEEVIDEGEYTFKNKYGDEVVWSFYSSPMGINEDGERQIITTAIDITDKKRTDEELKQYREHLLESVQTRTRELESKTANIEESRKALTFLLEDVNEARLELKHVNSQLKNVNKELEAFAYSVSHDLRAPVRHIDGFIQLLKKPENLSDSEKIKKYTEIISNSAQKMGRLIDDLLTFSRIGRNEPVKTQFNSNELIDEILSEFKPSFENREMDFEIEKLPDLNADRNLMRFVFYNLIDNALKFSRNNKKTKIKIGGKKQDSSVEIFIKDNGAGFNMKYADKLFGVFQRLHTENEFEGTGIGLASVQRIIHKHGGKVWAEGKVNKGATFYISL